MPSDPTPVTSNGVWGQVDLTWGFVSGADGYRVYRKRTSVAGATYQLILDTTDLSYSDIIAAYDLDTLGTVTGEEWKYKIVAYDSGGESTGIEATVTMLGQTPPTSLPQQSITPHTITEAIKWQVIQYQTLMR